MIVRPSFHPLFNKVCSDLTLGLFNIVLFLQPLGIPIIKMTTDNRVSLDVSLRVSPTLSLHDPQATLDVGLYVKVAESARPGVPITIMLFRNVFEVAEPGDGLDMFARGAFAPLKRVNDPEGRKIHLGGHLRVNERIRTDVLDLRERGFQFATISGDSSEISFTHHLDWDRIFKYADNPGSIHSKDELAPGDKFRIGVNKTFLEVPWWCFGDLDGDLRDKKFHPWLLDSGEESDRPSDDFLRDGGWILGEEENEDGPILDVVLRGQNAVFEIVE